MRQDYRLPSKIISYLKRLDIRYARSDSKILSKVIQNGHIYVEEEVYRSDFQEDYYGHEIFYSQIMRSYLKLNLRTRTLIA